jgi:hypothetical protein
LTFLTALPGLVGRPLPAHHSLAQPVSLQPRSSGPDLMQRLKVPPALSLPRLPVRRSSERMRLRLRTACSELLHRPRQELRKPRPHRSPGSMREPVHSLRRWRPQRAAAPETRPCRILQKSATNPCTSAQPPRTLSEDS